jgi:hypothetical protein
MKAIYFIPLVFLSACSTTPKLVLRPQQPPPAADDSAVRYPEVIRAYHVGRYVDPNDDQVMHEQHVVYRVEENTRWNLHPGPAGGSPVLLAPLRNAAFSPTPVNDTVLAEVNNQRLATVQIEMEAKTLASALAQFETALQQAKTNLREMAVLRVQVSDMQQQLAALKAAEKRNAASIALIPTNRPPDSFDTNSFPTDESAIQPEP